MIRWINDRFQQQAASAGSGSTRGDDTRPGTPAVDQMLVVDELAEFFERPGVSQRMHREAAAEPEKEQGIDSLVRGFVSDFQRVALEWQGA